MVGVELSQERGLADVDVGYPGLAYVQNQKLGVFRKVKRRHICTVDAQLDQVGTLRWVD